MDGHFTAPDPNKLPGFTLEARDIQALTRFLAHRGVRSRKTRRQTIVSYGISALLVVAILYLSSTVFGLDLALIAGYVLPVFLLLALFIFILQRIHYRRATTMVAGSMSVWCADDGLHIADDEVHSTVLWGALRRIGETAEHILIDYGPYKATVVPKRIFDDPAQGDAFVADLRARSPELEEPAADDAKTGGGRRARWRMVGRASLAVLLVLLTVWTVKPWRDSIDLGGAFGTVSFMTIVSPGAAADAPLPLVIDLHPLGGSPELSQVIIRKRDFAARTVMPAGPIWLGFGNSWYSLDDDRINADMRESADRIAAFTKEMVKRYPTLGKPVVTGFSQGGALSYALAVRHPALFSAAVPVGGALFDHVPKPETPPKIKVRALHGAEDEVVLTKWGQFTVEEMRRQGWDATMRLFPGVGHSIDREMGDAWRTLLAEFTRAEAAARAN